MREFHRLGLGREMGDVAAQIREPYLHPTPGTHRAWPTTDDVFALLAKPTYRNMPGLTTEARDAIAAYSQGQDIGTTH